jgi:hypothetical protein
LKVELRFAQPQDSDLEKNASHPRYQPREKEAAAVTEVDDNDAYLVKFDEGDPRNPMNFNPYYKIWLVLQMSLLASCGLGGSSIISPAIPKITAYLHSSIEVQVLSIALFLLG